MSAGKKPASRGRSGFQSSTWLAGMAVADITPPLGTHLFGFAERDRQQGCQGIHDPLQVRAVYVSAADEPVVILSYDVAFFDRVESDRIKDAVGCALKLTRRQILINCSHSHVGPVTGTWGFAGYKPLKNQAYLDDTVAASARAAEEARAAARQCHLRSGRTRTGLPVSRRYLNACGKAEWRPAPAIPVYDALPVLCFEDASTGKPVALLFTVACHPSTVGGQEVSAEYPGVARELIDRSIGSPVAVFLQGVGGDTKPVVVADGAPDASGLASWRSGNWDDVRRAGAMVADAVLGILRELTPVDDPAVRSAIIEAELPLTGIPTHDEFERIRATTTSELRRLWAARQIELLTTGRPLPSAARILIQSIRLAEKLHLVALEGEPIAAWGWEIEKFFRGSGAVIPLGYSNGQGLYLPVESALEQGGYEVESAYEYGFAADQLAPGFSAGIFDAFERFKQTTLA